MKYLFGLLRGALLCGLVCALALGLAACGRTSAAPVLDPTPGSSGQWIDREDPPADDTAWEGFVPGEWDTVTLWYFETPQDRTDKQDDYVKLENKEVALQVKELFDRAGRGGSDTEQQTGYPRIELRGVQTYNGMTLETNCVVDRDNCFVYDTESFESYRLAPEELGLFDALLTLYQTNQTH